MHFEHFRLLGGQKWYSIRFEGRDAHLPLLPLLGLALSLKPAGVVVLLHCLRRGSRAKKAVFSKKTQTEPSWEMETASRWTLDNSNAQPATWHKRP